MSLNQSGVLRMAAPLVISFWMRAVVTFVDTIYAALLGDAAVAAVGLTVPFEFLMIALWVGLSTGLTSGLSRAIGERQGRKIEQYLAACRRLVWMLAPLFSLAGVALWWIAPRMGLEVEVAEGFRVYGAVLIAGSAFTSFWSILPDSLVKAHHDTRSTMWAGIVTNILNVGLNTLFMFVFHWGLFGIAFSTVISRLGGLVYALAVAERHESRRRREGETPGEDEDPHPYRAVLALAIPSSLTFALMALETAIVNGLLARMDNPTATIASYSIYYRVTLFCLQPVIACSVALLPYAARRFGAGDCAGVRAGLRDAATAAAVYALGVVGPVAWWAGPALAAWLAESPVTKEYTAFALQMVPLSCAGGALFLMCRPVFEAMNRGRPGLVMAIFRYLVLTVPLASTGLVWAERAGHPPIYGLITGLVAASAIASAVFYFWLRRTLARIDAGVVTPASPASAR